jgi:hypothetical protein
MGGTDLVCFVALGEKYLEQFKLCYTTIPKNWDVVLITNCDYFNENIQIIKIDKELSFSQKMAYRTNIPYLIDIEKYETIWYFDTDILFNGDVIKEVGKIKNITVSFEPNVSVSHDCMNWGADPKDLALYDVMKAPAINSGMFAVPKKDYSFFTAYFLEVENFIAKNPDRLAVDQLIFNKFFYEQTFKIDLFESNLINFDNKTERTYVNHYIGMHDDKIEKMKNEIKLL